MRIGTYALGAVLGVLAVLALGACNGGSSPTPTPSPETSPSPSAALSDGTAIVPECSVEGLTSDLVFDGDRRQFERGEPVSMTLVLTNCGDNEITLFYPDGQRYDFIVEDETSAEVWRWSHNRAFEDTLGEESLGPEESLTYTESWDQREADGEPAPPGSYQIWGFGLGCLEQSSTGCRYGPGLLITVQP